MIINNRGRKVNSASNFHIFNKYWLYSVLLTIVDAPLQYKYPWKSTTQKKIDLMLNWFVKSQDYVICGYLLGALKLVDLIYNNKRQQKNQAGSIHSLSSKNTKWKERIRLLQQVNTKKRQTKLFQICICVVFCKCSAKKLTS